MKLDKLTKAVSKFAPILGGVIGGPAGGAVGTGISLIAKAFGADPTDPADILEKIELDPQAAVKLKEIEAKHEEKLIELQMAQDKMYLDDVSSARNREIEITRATKRMNYPLYILAGVITAGVITLSIVLFKYNLPEANKDLGYILFGGLITNFGMVVSYFFGSSKGSSDKNQMLASSKDRD